MVEFSIVGGLRTIRASRAKLAGMMVEDCEAARSMKLPLPKLVFSSNGSVIARYHGDPVFRSYMDRADIVDADGMPLVFASRFFCARPLVERVATTDFINDAAAAAARSGLNFYFLGGKPGVAASAARNLRARYPEVRVVGAGHGYFAESELDRIVADILERKTDVLWLGLGSPYQEEMSFRLRGRLGGVGWIHTCGGLFDHMSGPARARLDAGLRTRMVSPHDDGAAAPRLALHPDQSGRALLPLDPNDG